MSKRRRGRLSWASVPFRLLVVGCGALLAGFGLVWTAVWVVLGALPQRWWVRVVWAAVGAWFWSTPALEYADRVEALAERLDQGPTAYGLRDKAGIWGLNLVMAMGGLPVAPEAALETLLLTMPADKPRAFESDFAMQSPRVRTAVQELSAAGGRTQVQWPNYDADRRAAFALNPATIEVEKAGDLLLCSATVDVRYPKRGFVQLFTLGDRPIGIEEGLFGMLQDAGWLFPYSATWAWVVQEDAI